jgi:hypothetical protein
MPITSRVISTRMRTGWWVEAPSSSDLKILRSRHVSSNNSRKLIRGILDWPQMANVHKKIHEDTSSRSRVIKCVPADVTGEEVWLCQVGFGKG